MLPLPPERQQLEDGTPAPNWGRLVQARKVKFAHDAEYKDNDLSLNNAALHGSV